MDDWLDAIMYRPVIVRAFMWLPRWWLCDLAKLSIALDERWGVGHWNDDKAWPGRPCEACGRRASIHTYGGRDRDETPTGEFLDTRTVQVCGWCRPDGPMMNEDDVQQQLAKARRRSIAWRWSASA